MHDADRSFEVAGNWIKWSRYDLVAGSVFPSQGAILQTFDPWSEFRSNVGRYRTVNQPYVSLLEFHRHLKNFREKGILPTWPTSRTLTPIRGVQSPADQFILDWCAENGLFGLLPTLSDTIVMPPERSDDGHLVSLSYVRCGGQWLRHTKRGGMPFSSGAGANHGLRWLEPIGHLHGFQTFDRVQTYFRPCVEVQSVTWLESYRMPMPWSQQFWEDYGEPVREMIWRSEEFADAVDIICNLGSKSDEEQRRAAEAAHHWLAMLAVSVAPSFEFNSVRCMVSEVRFSPGLIASFALMVLWDLAAGRRVLRCENCDRYFVSDEHRAKYCSVRCRNTSQNRRYRVRRAAQAK